MWMLILWFASCILKLITNHQINMVWRYRFYTAQQATLHVYQAYRERSKGKSCISPPTCDLRSHRPTSTRQQPTNDYEQNSNRPCAIMLSCTNSDAHTRTMVKVKGTGDRESIDLEYCDGLRFGLICPPKTHLHIYDIIIKCSHLITRSKSQCVRKDKRKNEEKKKKLRTNRTAIAMRMLIRNS